MQNYSKPISGVTTFPQLYALIGNTFDTLLSRFSGTAFPANPVAGQPCYRTDRLSATGYPKYYTYSGNTALGEMGWVEDVWATTLGEELANARGTKSSLDQRLDVALNEDGTLKASTTLSPSQWFLPTGWTWTYLSTTSWKVAGDQTDIYKATRRLKVNLAASTAYTEVVSSSFAAGPNETTIQTLDAVLDNTLVTVEHSLFLPATDDADGGKTALSPRMVNKKQSLKDHGTKSADFTLDISLADMHIIAFSAAAILTFSSTKATDKALVIVKNGGFAITVAGIDNDPPTLTNGASKQDYLAIAKSFGKIGCISSLLSKTAV